MMNATAAIERQERIEAFKKKIAGLHATSRNYNITSDCSINTLDSSFAAASVNSSSNITRDSSDGSVDMFRDANKANSASAKVVSTPNERRCPEETTNLPTLLDDEDDDVGSENERETIMLTTSDDEGSDSTGSLFARDSKSVADSDLFDGMLNAFRKSLLRANEPGENHFPSDDEDSGSSTSQPFASESNSFNPVASDDDDSVSTSQKLLLEEMLKENHLLEGRLNTFRGDVIPSINENENEGENENENEIAVDETRATITHPVILEEKIIGASHRPAIVTTRAISQSSKVSACTLATSGGFSIESVAASRISANSGTSGKSVDTGLTSGGFSIQSIADAANGGNKASYTELVTPKIADEQIERPLSVVSSTSTSTDGELESISSNSVEQGQGEVLTSPIKIHVTKTIPPEGDSGVDFVGYTEKIVSQRLRRLVEIGREIKELQDSSDAGSTAENSSCSSRRGKRERRYSTMRSPSLDSSSLSKCDEKQNVESSEMSAANDISLANAASTMAKNQAPSNPFADLLRLRQSHKMTMKKFDEAESSVASATSNTCSVEATPTTAIGQQVDLNPTPHKNDVLKAPSSNPYADMLKLRQTRKMAAEKTPINTGASDSLDDFTISTGSKSVNTVVENVSVASSAIKNYIAETLSASQSPRDSTSGRGVEMSNLYSDLLKLRQTRKAAIERMLKKSVGNVALDDSSSADTSMSSNFTNTEVEKMIEKNTFPMVCYDDDKCKESLNGALFSNLKQALSKIQSVDNDEDTDEDENDPHVIVKDMESCAISSLKDESYIVKSRKGNMHNLDDDDHLFIDDDDEVNSVPKSPASLDGCEDDNRVHEAHHASSNKKSRAQEVENKRTLPTTRSGDDDNDTVARANSNKVDYFKEKDRNTTLTPPRKGVVLSDGSASISTKDSILGRSINISNDALLSERIYLESLRAQVHAELKVHVADEEIRLALAARLHAIQDFYKRKATVLSLGKSTSFPISPKSPLIDDEDDDAIVDRFGGGSRKVETVNSHDDMSMTPDSSVQPDVNPAQQRHDSHTYALQRAQAKMNEAIRAAHSSPKSSSYVPHNDEEGMAVESGKGGIPGHFFPNDTFWFDEDDPHFDLAGMTTEIGGVPARAEIAQNAWRYYLNINSLIFDSRVYDYEYQQILDDPLYPYLESLVGIADSGEDGYADENKRISQEIKMEYEDMSSHRICHSLANDAEDALPGLKAICTDLGGKLGIQTMAVGPVKKPSEALLKCERKYGGDPLLVTDYCRASLFVKDVATLLALIEIVLSKYTSIVRRIKLSTLKSDHDPLLGGYRDCKINLDVGGHVCEIQVHLIPMWLVNEANGYGHYKSCCEHNVFPSTFDIGRTLAGLSRSVLNDLVLISEADMDSTPVESLQHYQEGKIRDYYALANLYICHSRGKKAENILRRTAKLRSESEKFGRHHPETTMHLELLRRALKLQHRYKSAAAVKRQIKKNRSMQGRRRGDEPTLSELWADDQCSAFDRVCDMILDPSKFERQNEEHKAVMVDESRAVWLRKRRDFFHPSGEVSI